MDEAPVFTMLMSGFVSVFQSRYGKTCEFVQKNHIPVIGRMAEIPEQDRCHPGVGIIDEEMRMARRKE